ncbi:Site-specific recombinase XerD [Gemmobacter aquatilis]|uniref:Site-specific recombinase XerD n=1 Tax=Gemmobacter aquatilis TaxID=933059 RepID=A0A1H8C8K7_9RHOB|nr:tyrosine-type recombinase/integrase [Gemmobacter aquatilis]SEM91395.1 Site-specific recombinase XerD [Gemmobacter aquatilis]
MPPKSTKNTDLPPYVTKTPAGAYKYQRRVPKHLQEAIGKRMWDYSLTSNPANAYRMAEVFRVTHDRQIEGLESPEAKAREHELWEVIDHAHKLDDMAEVWRKTPVELKDARSLSASAERDRLTSFAAIAFGMTMQTIVGPQTVVKFEPRDIIHPTDPTDSIMFTAYKSALEARLAQIVPADSTDPMRLSVLIEAYSKAQAARPTTANGYRRKIDRLVRHSGDHGLEHYDESILRAYRDYLIAGDPTAKPKPFSPVKPATVHQYFAPLKAMWKWAADEYPEHKELTFPRVRLPKDGDTVEDTRWQAFDDQQIKTVWRALSAAWGDDGDTRLTPSRRRAFLMAVRVLLYTGMRPSEVFRLTAGDVKDGAINIRYTKTKQARRIPLAAALSDFPDFLAAGGFAAELEAGRNQLYGGKVRGKPTTPESLAKTLRGNFAEVIHGAGIIHPKLVLYSLKDTLIDRLQRQGASDDVMRGIIGHVGGQGKLRHYKTPFGQSPHGMAQMRAALDAIEYW